MFIAKRDGKPEKAGIPSLGDTPKTQSKGEKREAPSPPEERIAKKGKGSSLSSYSEASRSQAPKEIGEWKLVEEKKEKRTWI